MYAFKIERPTSVRQAASLLANEDAKLLAGGHSLIPVMKQRLASPKVLVDLSKIDGLTGIEVTPRTVTIKAMTRHRDVANSKELLEVMPALASVPDSIGDPHVRGAGTIGGSVANNDPNADYPAAVLALGATIVTNKRKIAADDYFKGMFETALEAGRDHHRNLVPDRQEGGVPEVQASGVGLRAGRGVRVEALVGNPRGGDRGGIERCLPRAAIRGGAEEALRAEIAGGHHALGRRHEFRHSRLRRIPRAYRGRDGAPRGGGCQRAGRRRGLILNSYREDGALPSPRGRGAG